MTGPSPNQTDSSDRRNRRDCDEAVEEVAEKAASEIAKAWTDQQSDAEALVRIDEILGEATGSEAVDGGPPPQEWIDAAQRGLKREPSGQAPFEGPKGDPAEGKRSDGTT